MTNPEFGNNPFIVPPDRAEWMGEGDEFQKRIEANHEYFNGIKDEPKYAGNLVIVDNGRVWTISPTANPQERGDFFRKAVEDGATTAAYIMVI